MQKKSFPIAVKYAAYAGLMFFSFLVEKKLQSDYQVFDQEDRDFINGWCQVWTFSWYVFACLLFCAGISFSLDARILHSLFVILLGMLIIIQFASAILISLDIPFRISSFTTTKEQQIQLFRFFVPVIVEKVWFRQSDFSKPNWWLKESQIWWWIIVVLCIISPKLELIIGFFWLLIVRLAFLYCGKDVVVPELKMIFHRSYVKYVEEIFLIPYVFLKSWKDGEVWFNLSLLQEYQWKIQDSNFFASRLWILIFGGFLLLIAVFGWWSGIWRKSLPLLWWLLRWSVIKTV